MDIVLADDHNLVRKGIRALLEALPGVRVVGEASDGQAALKLITTHRPHIAVLDISMHAGEGYVAQALRAGVAGYLLKDAADDELALAMTAVSRGDVYLSPQ